MKKRLIKLAISFILVLLPLLFLVGCEETPIETINPNLKTGPIKNVILFIGDGMGPVHVEAGALYKNENLVFQDFPVQGSVTTNSLSFLVTDSAAAATAMATGEKAYNKSVGMNVNGSVLTPITDVLSEVGIKTGVLTTDYIYGATPSGFLSHASSRNDYDSILENMALSKANLIMGKSSQDLFSQYEQNFIDSGFSTSNTMSNLNVEDDRLVVGLPSVVASGSDPTLSDLVYFALDFLVNDQNGFFLMVEEAHIDKTSHSKDVEKMLIELLALDEVVDIALDWAANRDDTVIIVTADHETGGLRLADGANHDNILESATFTASGHTSALVDYYVWSDNDDINQSMENDTELFKDAIDNTDIFKICKYFYLED